MAGLAPITTQASLAGITEDLRTMRLSRKSRQKSQASILDTSSASASNASRSTYGSSSTTSAASRPSLVESERRKSSLKSILKFGVKPIQKKGSISLPSTQPQHSRNVPARRANIFLALPPEIQLTVLSHLSTTDLLALRVTSPATRAILSHNAPSITRELLLQPVVDHPRSSTNLLTVAELLLGERAAVHPDHHGFLLDHYPPTYSSPNSDGYLLRMLRRQKTTNNQINVLLTFVQTRVYMLKLTQNLPSQQFGSYREGLRRRLFEPLACVQHYLECIRHVVLHVHPQHKDRPAPGDLHSCSHCMKKLKEVVNLYSTSQLLNMLHILNLLLTHLRTAVRSPSTVSALERRLRGWGYGPPPEEHIRQLVLLGGLPEVCMIDEMKGSYAKRLGVVKGFADTIDAAQKLNSGSSELYIVYGKGRVDPLMGRQSLSEAAQTSTKHPDLSLPDAIEHHASSQPTTKSLDVDLNCINDSVLASMPDLEDFLVGKDSLLCKRILADGLAPDMAGLGSPYTWIQKTMGESYDGRKEMNATTTRRTSIAEEGDSDVDEDSTLEAEL
ncbi:hypothetical protein LTR66_014479 [Elasticomyces elasticus]|nr:hypothetical protein LTR66_014479 [Elasticomyces elasticus]